MWTVARWVAARLVRTPLAWLCAISLAALWLAVVAITPLGLASSVRTEQGALHEILFLGILAGQLFGMHVLRSARWLLEGAAPATRLTLELTALSSASAVLTTPALLAALALGGGPGLGIASAPALLAHLHLAGFSLVLLRLPGTGSLPLVVLPLGSWLVPALLGAQFPGPQIGYILGAARHLAFPLAADPAGEPQWAGGVLPIIGLIGAAYLLAHPRGHALRDSR